MTDRQFHDTVIQADSMPLAALRARLLGLPMEREFRGEWGVGEGPPP